MRAQIEEIEAGARRVKEVLPFGLAEVDSRLRAAGCRWAPCMKRRWRKRRARRSRGGSVRSGIAARAKRKTLWCLTRPDLFAPALAQAGLGPDGVIYVEAGDERSVLACFEEGLRYGGLGSVVAEVSQLSMTASRRLQLAAEGSGTIALALRRWRRQVDASDFGQPTAASTRWRVSVIPSGRCRFPASDATAGWWS